jgi:DNA invertase Pin-like site-specific DNA recombinase
MAGLNLLAVIREEGVSAAKLLCDRPSGQKMLRAIATQHARHIVAMKLDRLFRDAADALNQTRVWDRAGIVLHLVDMGGQTLNTATALGRMFFTMTAAFAELERNLIAERTQVALAYKKSKLLVYSSTPFGYTRNGDALRVEKAEFETIRQVRKWRAHGWSLRRIAGELNRKAIPTKRGRRWHASTVGYILGNSLYQS